MNARNKKYVVGAAVLAIAIPAIGFAATGSTAATATNAITGKIREMRAGSGSEMGFGRHEGGGMGRMGAGMGGETFLLSNEKVRETLAASGVTLPSTETVTAYQEKMKAARDAQEKLSETEQTELKAIRDAGMEKVRAIQAETAKSEREYLRSKGVALPTEAEITEMSEVAKKAGEVLRAKREELGMGDGTGFGKGMGGGKRGGFRGERPTGTDIPEAGSAE